MHAYVLLDRTGSMSPLWDEALSSVNAFATSLTQKAEGESAGEIDPRVTLAAFDAQDGLQFDVLRANVRAADWNPVSNKDATPRGMTPLFDAIARIIALAETDAPDKAVIVVMTDGHENASREVTKDGAKAAIERAEKRGWEVVFLGAQFGEFSDADALGVKGSQTMAMSTGNISQSMSRLASKTRRYAKGDGDMAFDAADRLEAGEADVKGNRQS